MLDFQTLRRVDLLALLSDAQLSLIWQILQTRVFAAGSVIFHEGDAGEAVYFVSSGQVKISTSTADGKEKVIKFMGEGQVFGEVVLLEGGPYPATATATEKTTVGVLRNVDFIRLVASEGELATNLLILLSRRLRMAQNQLKDLALKDAQTRVGELVLGLAEQTGQPRPDGLFVELTATREQLANLTSTTRETFTRMLGEYRRLGLIQVVSGGLLVPDLKRLRDHLR